PSQQLRSPLDERSMLPFVERNAAALVDVVGHITLQLTGEVGIANGEVDLIVDAEGAVVEVGGADHGPEVIYTEYLGMDHGGLVLVDFSACLQKWAIGPTACAAGEEMIAFAAGHQHPHLDAAFDGAADLAGEAFVGKKIGRSDGDAVPGRGQQHLEEDARAGGTANGGGAVDDHGGG